MLHVFILFCSLLTIINAIFAQESASYAVIPKPNSMVLHVGDCIINRSTKIYFDAQIKITEGSPVKIANSQIQDAKELANFIADFLGKSLGTSIQVKRGKNDFSSNNISIIIDPNMHYAPEAYSLSVNPHEIIIKASTCDGAFWGFQTLRQLMPVAVESQFQLTAGYLEIPCVQIDDEPRFLYRGLHLDVSRHMFSISCIKKYIDTMSLYKFNKLHLHLSDDQGWRFEVKQYPKLQEIAAYRDATIVGHNNSFPRAFDGIRYGGFYTQEELKDLVEYARLRHITIIPEIELPGHCMAALAAYPELGCKGAGYKTGQVWGIYKDIYCAGNEKTFEFLQNVFDEIIDIFPSNYIHIGGDEAPKNLWKNCPKCQAIIKKLELKDEDELQSYCIKRIEKYLNSKGRYIIGWDEILDGGIAPHATIMSWRGEEGGICAAQQEHYAIMTPEKNYILITINHCLIMSLLL